MSEAAKNAVAKKITGEGPKSLTAQLMDLVPQMAKALPNGMDADRMARIALTEFKKNPGLQKCTPGSLFGSLLTASQLGLEPGPLGHVYLIPYGDQCTIQLGYRGILDLVSRSDKVDSVFAYPVFEGDEFAFNLGSRPDVQHTPDDSSGDVRGERELTHAYAVAWIKGSSIPRIEVMTKKQIDSIRDRAKAGKNGPWVTDYSEMARKTVLKRLCKTLPLSITVQSALAKDETIRTDPHSDDLVSVFEVEEGATDE